MKSLFLLIFLFVLTFSSRVSLAQAENSLDPRIKAVAVMSMYGTVGGALLGTASLAFGTSSRSIAKGASLGLYTGLLFGGYVVVSHAMRKKAASEPPPENYYPEEDESEYDEEEEDGQGGYEEEGDDEYRWRPLQLQQLNWRYQNKGNLNRPFSSRPAEVPLIYFNLVDMTF